MTSLNSALFRVAKGWLLVRLDEVGKVLARHHLRQEIERNLHSRGQVFHVLELRTSPDAAPQPSVFPGPLLFTRASRASPWSALYAGCCAH